MHHEISGFHIPPLKEIVSSKFTTLVFMSDSSSHMPCSIPWCCRLTFTRVTSQLLTLFISQSSIHTGPLHKTHFAPMANQSKAWLVGYQVHSSLTEIHEKHMYESSYDNSICKSSDQFTNLERTQWFWVLISISPQTDSVFSKDKLLEIQNHQLGTREAYMHKIFAYFGQFSVYLEQLLSFMLFLWLTQAQ